MKLESFRELLLKKSSDPSLQNLIAFVKDDILADIVVESLEKMARAKHKGDAANLATRHFGLEMDPETEPTMLHDAMSHHASRYKAAVGAGRNDLANQHAKQLFRLVDMGDQAQKHSQGKLHVEAVSPHAWERNAKQRTFTADDEPVKKGNKKVGQFVTDTKGWRHRGSDYSFLQQAPHSSYGNEIRKHGHNQAYPMEQIRVNGKYLDIQDVPPDQLKGYDEHIFDKHPIMSHFEDSASKRSPEDDARYVKEHEAYNSSPHMDSHFAAHEKMEQENPDHYKARGSVPSDKVHKDVTPLDTTGVTKQSAQAAQMAPKKEEATAAQSDTEISPEHQKIIDSLPPAIRDRLMGSIKK